MSEEWPPESFEARLAANYLLIKEGVIFEGHNIVKDRQVWTEIDRILDEMLVARGKDAPA